MPESEDYGFVITLGTKTYPGPLNRRRVEENVLVELPPDTVVFEDEVYEIGVYV